MLLIIEFIPISSLSLKMSDQPSFEHPGKHPPKNFNAYPAIISFISGGRQVAIGNLEKHYDEDVQVALTSRHTATHSPYLGLRFRLRRSESTMHLYEGSEKEFHTVLFRFFLGDYEIYHRRANPKEKERLISNAANNGDLTQRACDEDKLYLVNFFSDIHKGPRVDGLGSSFVGANEAVNDTYNLLSSVASNNSVDAYLWEYDYVSPELQWSVADQETGGWFS